MKIGDLDTNEKVVVIAEIGNNHEGSFDVAARMVEAAAKSGADIVKFQTFIPERFISAELPDRLATLRRFQLSFAQFEKLSHIAKDNGITFLSTPLDLESLDFLAGISSAIKISSGDNTFVEMLRRVGRLEHPTIISAGLADKSDMIQALNLMRQERSDKQIAVLHCVTAYPTPPEEANVGAVFDLQDIGANAVGYSDHTTGALAVLLSVGAGARIIEKHFTLDNNFSDFRDHKLSLMPGDFGRMVQDIRLAEQMLGGPLKGIQEAEKLNKTAVRRSAAAASDLAAGHVITESDLLWVRPGTGYSYHQTGELIGRRLAAPIAMGALYKPELIAS